MSDGNTISPTYNGSVTITPNATTGGTIWYQALSDCNQSNFTGYASGYNITINRGTPTFSISPSSLQFTCGTGKTQTFTVTQSGSTTCGVSYVWNLGANNGWLYNGSPAPASITAGTSITLTSANGNVLPAPVSVTPYLGGNPLAPKTCTTSFTPFTTTASILGTSTICTPATTASYTINGLLAGQTVTWSSSNTSVATVSFSGNTATVTKVSNGSFNLLANISNTCGQTVILPPFPIKILDTPTISLSGSPSFCLDYNKREENKITVLSPNAIQYQWQVGNFIGEDIDTATMTIFYGKTKVSALTTISNSVYFSAPTEGNVTVHVRSYNGCTWSSWLPIYIAVAPCTTTNPGGGTCSTCYRIANQSKLFSVYPNPSNEIINIELKDQNSKLEKDKAVMSAELFDMLGLSISKIDVINNKSTFSVYGLKKGIYVLKININDNTENHQIVVE